MNALYWISLILACAIAGYLFVALLWPEKF